MKIIRPLRLGVMHKTFEHMGSCRLAITASAFFAFDAPHQPLTDVAMWKLIGSELGKDGVFDMFMPKPRAEVLAWGKCFAPGALPARSAQARVCVSRGGKAIVDKHLNVFGDRRWKTGIPGGLASDPEPFLEMPIRWDLAFGGPGFAGNPVGKGAAPLPPATDGSVVHPLPNVELRRHPIVSPDDKPQPAGLGVVDFALPQRQSKAGTYDEKWLKQRFPGLADDIDMSIWNAAQEDQWLDGYLRGDETFEVSGMHPTRASVTGRVPDWIARCWVTKRVGNEDRFIEVPMQADTLCLFPAQERGIVLYRGVLAVDTDDAEDVVDLMVGVERRDAPRGADHYRSVHALRCDPADAAFHLLRDDQLIPMAEGDVPSVEPADAEFERLVASEGKLEARLRLKARKDLDEGKARLSALRASLVQRAEATSSPLPDLSAIDRALELTLPPVQPAPTLEQLPEVMAQARAQMETSRAAALVTYKEAMKSLREQCAKLGQDPDKFLAALEGSRPPRFSAAREMDRLQQLKAQLDASGGRNAVIEELLGDKTLGKRLADAEAMAKRSFQQYAHVYRALAPLAPAERARLRAEVQAARAAGRSLCGVDLCGADLSGLDLRGADFGSAMLEACDFSGSDLSGANLEEAVLSRSLMAGTKLVGARLARANLGRVDLTGADLSGGTDLSGATLAHARLDKANLTGALMAGTDLLGVDPRGANLTGVRAPDAKFIGAEMPEHVDPEEFLTRTEPVEAVVPVDFTGAILAGADFSRAIMYACRLDAVDLAGALLRDAVLVSCTAEGASFRGSDLGGARAVLGFSAAGADFQGANLGGSSLREADLSKCDFTGAKLDGCDLTKARLVGAVLRTASARTARLAKADLSRADLSGADIAEAILQKARLEGADLRKANLAGADLLRITHDPGTVFTGANLKKTLFARGAPR